MAGRPIVPSAAIPDSQSVQTTEKEGPKGFATGKKVNGRKRHLQVDTQGRLLQVLVHRFGFAVRFSALSHCLLLPLAALEENRAEDCENGQGNGNRPENAGRSHFKMIGQQIREGNFKNPKDKKVEIRRRPGIARAVKRRF